MEMTHVIYLTAIVLLVAAGGYLVLKLGQELSFEKEIRRISERIEKLYESKVWELKKELEKSKAELELCKIDKDMLLKSCKRRKGEVEALKKQVEQLKPKAQETETLTAKLQSAYGRIGALTQQVNRMKEAKKAVKSEVEAVEVKPTLPNSDVPSHLFTKFPQEVRKLAWEEMKRLETAKAKMALKGRDFPLQGSFIWVVSKQGDKFWAAWDIWTDKGANPNEMPPTDPNDPMYK